MKEILDKYFSEYDFYADRESVQSEIHRISSIEGVSEKDLYREWGLQALGFPPLRDILKSEHFQWLLRQDNRIH